MLPFLNPLFLIGAVAALAPLLLHLMQRSRTVRMPISTIRFLVLAQKRSSRRIRMQHWLLWMMRTLLVLLLAAAFAMPILRATGFSGFLGSSDRDVAILLDASYSMDYVKGSSTVWEDAVAAAVAIVEGLNERDRVAVFLAEEQPLGLVEQLSHDHEGALARLRAHALGFGTSQLAPALQAANASLKTGTGRREREIHILTDHQFLPWMRFGDAGVESQAEGRGEWDPAQLADRTMVFATLLGVTAPENVTPSAVALTPPMVMADAPIRVDVTLSRTGPASESAVALILDGAEFARRSVALPESGVASVRFTLPPLGAGVHALAVETPPDNLSRDNRLHFLIRTREAHQTLCVGSEADTFFLRAALRSGREALSSAQARRVDPQALAGERLEEATTLFLCNVADLSGQAILRLEAYVRAGGLLVLFPGDATRMEHFEPWSILPAAPEAIADLPPRRRTQSLEWRQPRHPLLQPIATDAQPPNVVTRRFLDWRGRVDPTRVLIAMDEARPFLILHPVDLGHVAVFAVSADRAWSDFPLSPFYLPVVHQLVRFGSGIRPAPPFYWTQPRFELGGAIADIGRDDRLWDERGHRVPVHASVREGRTVLHIDASDRPGILARQAAGDPRPAPALAFNMPRAESDLTPIRPADIPDRLGLDRVVLSESLPELLNGIESHRIGRTFGEHLLWLALILAVLEFCYANRAQKASPGLSETLRIEHSGRIAARKG